MKSVPNQKLFLNNYQSLVLEQAQQLENSQFVQRFWKQDAALWKKEPEHVKIINNSLGWITIAKEMSKKLASIESFAKQVHKLGFKDIVLLGMGGSSLAAEVFRLNLPSKKASPRLHVLDSTDPAWVDAIAQNVQSIKKTLFILSSKSGSTAEPLAFYNYFFELTGSNGNQFVAITDPGSYLEGLAKEKKFLKTFLNPSNIGGRFSALSYFGLVPAVLAGKNVKALLASTLAMMDKCQNKKIEENPAAFLGTVMGTLAQQGRDKLTLLMPENIAAFGLWIEQLVAESSGKEDLGIVPIAQESLTNANLYGQDRLFVSVELKGKGDKKIKSLVDKLKQAGHPVIEIQMSKPEDLGAELWRWETATAAACSVLKVNTFDQPDVQSAKALTQAALAALKAQKTTANKETAKPGFELSFSKVYEKQNSQMRLKTFLRDVGAGDYWGILAFLPQQKKLEFALKKLRTLLQTQTQKATLFGYGPRYLHSTGQLHKGGANNGLFIILTAPAKKDLPVPNQGFSFAQLETAQALGDFQALDAKKRRVLRLHLMGSDPAASLESFIRQVNTIIG